MPPENRSTARARDAFHRQRAVTGVPQPFDRPEVEMLQPDRTDDDLHRPHREDDVIKLVPLQLAPITQQQVHVHEPGMDLVLARFYVLDHAL